MLDVTDRVCPHTLSNISSVRAASASFEPAVNTLDVTPLAMSSSVLTYKLI